MSDESIEFGDYEPEDAWQPDDPVPLLIGNLLARLDILDGLPHRRRFVDLLDLVEDRLRPWLARRDGLENRAQVRIDQLAEDLAFLRQRDEVE